MDFANSALSREFKAITENGDTGVNYKYSATLHANGVDLHALKVIDMVLVADFINGRTDNLSIRLLYTAVTWIRDIYEYRNDLYMTIKRIPLYENTDAANVDRGPEITEYKAIAKIEGLPVLKGTEAEQWDDHKIDNVLTVLEIEFQLVDKTYEAMRTVIVGGTYRDALAEDVLKYILASEGDKLNLSEDQKIESINMVSGSNQTKQKQIIIPDGVALTDVGTHLQLKGGGIYNAGMACYFTKRAWHIFPPYDTTQEALSSNTVTIYNIPTSRSTGIERTFRIDGGNVFILATSTVTFSDDNGSNFLNEGSGARFSDASKFMDSTLVTNKDNKSIIERSKLNNEYTITEKSTKEAVPVYVSGKRITANQSAQMSQVIARQGGIVSLKWENCDYNLLTPGMKVKVVWGVGEELKELTGILIFIQATTQALGKGMITPGHQSTCGLSIFVNEAPPVTPTT